MVALLRASAWLTRIRRTTQRRQYRDVDGPEMRVRLGVREPVDRSARPDVRAYQSQLRRRLRLAILDLPVAYRAPIVLRDLRGVSTAPAGAVLALKPQTLKSRLHRGHLMLRARLSDLSTGLAWPTAAADALTNVPTLTA